MLVALDVPDVAGDVDVVCATELIDGCGSILLK